MHNGNFRHLAQQGGGAQQGDAADLIGMLPSAGHYRLDPGLGHLNLADLHSIAHPVPNGAQPGFMGPARGNRNFELFPNGICSMFPSAGEVRGTGSFPVSSHPSGSPHENMNGEQQRASTQHPSDYCVRGKPTQTSPHFSASPFGIGNPPSQTLCLLAVACRCDLKMSNREAV